MTVPPPHRPLIPGLSLWAAFALLPLLAASPLRADDTRRGDAVAFQRLREGLERRSFRWQASEGAAVVRVHAFRIDPRRLRFRVVRSASGRPDTVHAIARAAGLVLAVNGSFFDRSGKAMGLVVDRGHRRRPLRRVDWGVFAVDRDGRARIVHTRRFKAGPALDAAIQAGPRLVVDGRPLVLKPQIARRTAACVDGRGRVVLLVTEGGVFLQDLANLLARGEGQGGFGCRDALNLDGGSSTQATLFLPGLSWDLHGGALVPVALGVEPGPPPRLRGGSDAR